MGVSTGATTVSARGNGGLTVRRVVWRPQRTGWGCLGCAAARPRGAVHTPAAQGNAWPRGVAAAAAMLLLLLLLRSVLECHARSRDLRESDTSAVDALWFRGRCAHACALAAPRRGWRLSDDAPVAVRTGVSHARRRCEAHGSLRAADRRPCCMDGAVADRKWGTVCVLTSFDGAGRYRRGWEACSSGGQVRGVLWFWLRRYSVELVRVALAFPWLHLRSRPCPGLLRAVGCGRMNAFGRAECMLALLPC